MAERITDEACSLLASKIDDIVTKITNGTLSKLGEKIDSEEFSEKIVNVIQQKLIDGMPPVPSVVTESTANKGGRSKRTRKVSRKSMSRKNRRNRANMLTKRNLFL
jgi:hypothetical protein